MKRRAYLFASVLALCAACPAASGHAAQLASMSARFKPERLARPTALSLGFRIAAVGEVPAPLRGVSLAYPPDLGFATSGLGLAACSPQALEALGPLACPANSRIGYGGAIVTLPIGREPVEESVGLILFAGPSPDGYLHILVYVQAVSPVAAQIVLHGVLRPRRIEIVVPPIPSLPEAPYVAVTQMHLTLGGDLTYYEQVAGRRVPYRPAGVGLPRTCPHGGFRFAASFDFLGGERAGARTSVACPRRAGGLPNRPRPG